MRQLFIISTLILFTFSGCKKNTEDTAPTPEDKSFNVSLLFKVDALPLIFDSIMYSNDAGNFYGVSNLEFYLSDFKFETNSGSIVSDTEVFYINAKLHTNTNFKLSNVPYGSYKRVSFLIGLDSAHNYTGGLPNTQTNMNMAWPEFMGGGYHLMKFEGSFVYNNIDYGYAMHLGKTQNAVYINLVRNISINSSTDILKLNMNLNEWFRNPYTFDFNIDGNYIMGNDTAMEKISANGVDVFNN